MQTPPVSPDQVGRGAQAGCGVWRATIACASTPAGSGAVLQPGVAGQPRGAERVGDRGRCVAHEQRALQRERHLLDDAAGTQLDRLGLDAQVGEHVGHERLVDEPLAERAAVGAVPGRVGAAARSSSGARVPRAAPTSTAASAARGAPRAP
jgi:hypothetical protein